MTVCVFQQLGTISAFTIGRFDLLALPLPGARHRLIWMRRAIPQMDAVNGDSATLAFGRRSVPVPNRDVAISQGRAAKDGEPEVWRQ